MEASSRILWGLDEREDHVRVMKGGMTIVAMAWDGTNDGRCRTATIRAGTYEAIALKRAISDMEMIGDIEFRVKDQGAHLQSMHFSSRSNGVEDPHRP